MDDLVVDRYAGAAGKAAVTEERGLRARVLDRLADDPVDFACRDAAAFRASAVMRPATRIRSSSFSDFKWIIAYRPNA